MGISAWGWRGVQCPGESAGSVSGVRVMPGAGRRECGCLGWLSGLGSLRGVGGWVGVTDWVGGSVWGG